MLPSIPLAEKANSTQTINGMGEETRREDVTVGVVGHLETLTNSSFPKEARQGTKAHITSKRKKQINSCASPLFSAQVYAGAAHWGGGDSVCVSRGGLASVCGSCEVSFASANETEPGWPVSPWQQAISTSLSAILAAMVVCLLVSLHPASLHPSSAGLITTTAAVALST